VLAPREQNVGDLNALVRRRDSMPTQALGDIFTISVLPFSHECILDQHLDPV